jgi:adenosyl cobinamide kinase/adenosyl cobinamide phosphate guanylyltransferase
MINLVSTMENALKSAVESMHAEDLLVEAMRDMVKDEIKHYVRQKLEENPQIKAEVKAAVRDLIDAKVREAYALVRLAKSGAELGLEIVPPEMKERLSKDIAALIEKEMSSVMDKM